MADTAAPVATSNVNPRNRKRAVILGFIALPLVILYGIYGGAQHEGPGTVHSRPLAPKFVQDRAKRQEAVPQRPSSKQILFGDLHVHTTFSTDAFLRSLPLVGGDGAHPPADACDFARYCSSLDFFGLTDHAEALTPQHWQESKDSIRSCNESAGDPDNPDLVAYMGFEWSQVGQTPAEHYGHMNVLFRNTSESDVPSRPIAAPGLIQNVFGRSTGLPLLTLASIPIREFSQRQRYLDTVKFFRETRSVPACPTGVDVHALPTDCREFAAKPGELFEKLAQWNMDSMVIPHGTTWGFYTPPGYTYDKQLNPAQRNPDKQRLIEVFSGHGNSEEYRTFKDIDYNDKGESFCPAPTDSYEPCCYRAGEIIRARCGNIPAEACEKRVEEARLRYLSGGAGGHLSVPGATVDDWKECGQCRDCFAPSFQYRPGGSVQYILAQGNFDNPQKPNHARFGFIGSSDNHSARPGTGYKEYARHGTTETAGACSEEWRERLFGVTAATPESVTVNQELLATMPPFRLVDLERQASFFMTGGLVAVHSEARNRHAIWEALHKREVYGTSGDRILLWFDRINGPNAPATMGSEATMLENPRFRVKAAGAFVQLPGCPDFGEGGLPAAEIARLCLDECYNPGDQRRLITRIEVVRIRPRKTPDEALKDLIQDPWKRIDCPKDPAGCSVEFTDDDFVTAARETVYYVRAIQEPTPAVNGDQLRCKRNEKGECIETRPCYGDYRTPFKDDCLGNHEERAWSSPIYLQFESPTPVQ